MSASAQGLCEFIDASPSPFHVCVTVAQRLRRRGLHRTRPSAIAWPGTGRLLHRARRLAGRVADATASTACRSGSSAATPTAPTCGSSSTPTGSSSGWQVVALQPYGGAWLNSWLDRDLGISGRLSVRTGDTDRPPAGPHRRADPAGAAAGHPPGRGPQGGGAGPAAARQRGLGRGQRDRSFLGFVAERARSTPTTCSAPT